MYRILDKAAFIHDSILCNITPYNPQDARKSFILTNFIIVQIINALKLNLKFHNKNLNNIEECFEYLSLCNQFQVEEMNDVLEHYRRNKDIFNAIEINKINIKKCNVFDVYESLLNLDISTSNNHFIIKNDNKSRDRSGAYYTSHSFAYNVVKKTINKYINKKMDSDKDISILIKDEKVLDIIYNTKIIDMSCGTGHFLFATIDYIEKLAIKGFDINNFIQNIYGIDVDIIALKIVITEMVCRGSKIELINIIKDNFIFGNTLLSRREQDLKIKLDEYYRGIIYSTNLGINQSKFEKGFDIIVGNPPWEKVRFEDKNFFSNYNPSIAKINKKNERQNAILDLIDTNPCLKRYSDYFISKMQEAKSQINNSIYYKYSSIGELNTYALFTELGLCFLKVMGEMCLIVKSSLITSKSNQTLFNSLLKSHNIDTVYDFVNTKKIFPIDSRERFSVIYFNKSDISEFELMMNLTDANDISNNDKALLINEELLSILNPKTKMIPNLKSSNEMELLLCFSKKFKTFAEEYPSAKFGRIVHFTNHAKEIIKEPSENFLPVYEGKFIEIYDGKFSTFRGMSTDEKYKAKARSRLMTEEEKNISFNIPQSRFFISKDKWSNLTKNYQGEFSILWRSLTSATNRRVTLATILPHLPTSQSIQLLQYGDDIKTLVLILALFNSVIFDYLVKLKLNGIDLTQTIINQIPVPSRMSFVKQIEFKGSQGSIEEHIFYRILKLYKNDCRLNNLNKYLELNLQKSTADDNTTREKLILELDVLIAHVYNIEIEQLILIMKEFPKFFSHDNYEYIRKLAHN